MKKIIPLISSTTASIATALVPLASAAASNIDTPGKVITIINKFGGWAYAALIAFAVIFIILAAFTFLTAGDDAEKVGKAKKQLIYAVIAVATAILATGIIKLTQILLGAS